MSTTLLLITLIASFPASYIAMVKARQYIARHREQAPVSYLDILTHWKSWLAMIANTILTGVLLYALLSAPFAAWYGILQQVLLAATVVLLAASGLCLTVIDLRTMKLPTKIIYPTALVTFILLSIVSVTTGDYSSILTMLLGGVGLFIALFVLWFFVPGGIGFGDVRLVLLTGGILGWLSLPHVFIGITLAFVSMSLVYLPLMITKAVGRKTKAPLGPWLLVGAYLAIIFGDILSGILFTGGLL